MDRDQVAAVLDEAEKALEKGETKLGPSGFWKAVGAAKRDPALVEEFGGRFATIDRTAFEKWAFFSVPSGIGTLLAVVWTIVGFGLILWAYSLDQPANGLVLLVGTAITLVTTHGLAHMVVGRLFGMRFTSWFVGSLRRPQPGVKVDYATYLRTPAKQRAWMHASGAVLTKLIPFFALGPALVMEAPWWTTALLVLLGVGQIVTDIVWSTKASDWKKYRRELGFR
ncbi:MAG: hypothetical protein KJN71_02055 [Acidimicrobiia bacterium]|nr:hypothetical protein [Acidimicrobiia bacterium]